ncbi:hypothetical protein [Streptomyces sp. TLI_185]|uniref:LexA family protein n=1 Tax=Streptomyces sp. TLI_185 TaxID=2485151 RepID=UPI000F4EE815|nr:hypothetical protein [Streptomyces sp. TLI_185]
MRAADTTHTPEQGEAPTVAEIGAALGMRSRASVRYQLGELEAKTAIVHDTGQPC